MDIDPTRIQTFAAPAEFATWLAAHHAQEGEVWVKIHKASSETASLTWGEAIVEALAWGWIDGIRKANDATSWFQRFTPRTPRSRWSQANRTHAERLIAEGRMQDVGLRAVDAARADGRWDAAYAGSAGMVFPPAFLAAVAADETAQATFAGLTRVRLYPFFYRLQTARREVTRDRLMAGMLDTLSRGEPLRYATGSFPVVQRTGGARATFPFCDPF